MMVVTSLSVDVKYLDSSISEQLYDKGMPPSTTLA